MTISERLSLVWLYIRCCVANRYLLVCYLWLLFIALLVTTCALHGDWIHMLTNLLPGIIPIGVLWLLRFGHVTIESYRRTLTHFRRRREIEPAFALAFHLSGYCPRVGFELACRDIARAAKRKLG